MRIGVLTTSYPRYRGDYAGLFVRGAVRALAARGHRVQVLAPESVHPTSGQHRHPNIEVVQVPYARPRWLQQTFYGAGAPENIASAPWRGAGVATFAAALAHQVRSRRHGWDAIMSHWALPCGLVAAAAAPKLQHLAVCHSADVHALTRPRLEPFTLRLRRQLVDTGTRFWFVSERHRDTFLDGTTLSQTAAVTPRAHVGSMGLSSLTHEEDRPDRRRRARARWGMDRFVVLALGRLVAVKGLANAVRAMAGLPDAELWLAGHGPQQESIERLARSLGVTLRAPGVVTGRDKQSLLDGADALVVPSVAMPDGRTEGFPTVINEAQASGLVVVASAVGGIPGMLRDGHDALLTPPGDPESLRRALCRLRQEPALCEQLRGAGLRRAKTLQWSALAPTIERLLFAENQTEATPRV